MTGAKVKQLDWHNFDAWTYWAEAVCGTYHVEERNGWWQVEVRFGGLVHVVAVTDDTLPADLEAAKAAAQADYEARILAALEPVAAPDALHRSFPDAGDGRPMPPMGDELMTAGLSAEDARFVAVQLAQNGWMLTPSPVDASQTADPAINALDDLARLGQEFDAAPDPTLRPTMTMTDLMVDPDTLDAFMEANPLPDTPDPAAIREAALREAAKRVTELMTSEVKSAVGDGYNLGLGTAYDAILALIAKGAAE